GWQDGRQAENEAAELTQRYREDTPDCFGAASMDPHHACHNPELDALLMPTGAGVEQDVAGYGECWTGDSSQRVKSCTFGDPAVLRTPHVVLVGDSHARALLPAFVRLAER